MSIKNNFIAACLGVGLMAHSAFPISGTLTGANSDWTGSVDVTGNVVVPAGITLTITPGARIRSVGGNFSITANGPVKAVGTLADYIDFFNVNVILAPAAAQHDMEYCVLLTAADAIAVTGANAKLAHIQIQDFGTNGVNISGAASKVSLTFSTIGAKSRLFGGTEAVSVNVANGADQADVEIADCVLGFENKAIQTGLAIRGAGNAAVTSATVKVHHNLITGTRVGMGTAEAGNITNTDSDVKDIPNLDYHLWPYSAAINSADPAADFSAEPAPNGGRADMGYYGGTAQATAFQFKLVSPNGGDSLSPASSASIKWQGGKLLGAKKLELSIDSGMTWQSISASTDAGGTGVFAWTVPAVKSPNCIVRISLVTSAEGMDMSDRVFTIGDTVSKSGQIGTLKDPTPFRCIPFTAYHDGQQPGGAEPTEDQVKADLAQVKLYTREIRTYGSGTGTHGHSLPALCDAMGMKIHMGIWLDDSYTEAQNQASLLDGIALAKENHPSIKTVIVGNEFLLRVRQSHGNVELAEAKLVRYIKQVKAAVPAGIIVGTGESYPDWLAASDNLVNAVDRVIWHVHPWWEQKAAENAANHAFTVYNQMKARLANFPNKPMVLGETGWPTAATTGAAVGSPENQARYLKDLHAWAKKAGLDYWFFTNVDEKWKGNEGAVGAHWGMFNSDRTPKYTISHLDELVPAANRWENDAAAVGLVRSPGLKGQDPSFPNPDSFGIRIFDLQGRLIGPAILGSKGLDEAPLMLKNGLKAAQGRYLRDARIR
jgi:exo-beta-1,3-glucanase (GH17 family)